MGVDEVTPFEVTAADIDVFPSGLPPADVNGNDQGSPSVSSSSSLVSSSFDPTPVPDTTENNNSPLDPFVMNDPSQALPKVSVKGFSFYKSLLVCNFLVLASILILFAGPTGDEHQFAHQFGYGVY